MRPELLSRAWLLNFDLKNKEKKKKTDFETRIEVPRREMKWNSKTKKKKRKDFGEWFVLEERGKKKRLSTTRFEGEGGAEIGEAETEHAKRADQRQTTSYSGGGEEG